MKKRILALACSVLLTMGVSMTAFATPSVSVGDIQATDANGNPLQVIWVNETTDSDECTHENCHGTIEVVSPVTDEYRAVVDALPKTRDYDGKTWVMVYEFDVIAKDCVEPYFPITLTFNTEDWADGVPLIFHYENGQWVEVELLADGTCFKATFNSFSPFVVYEEVTSNTGSGSTGSSDSVKPSNPTSPSTGETPAYMWFACAAVGAAGVVLVSRKKEA